MMVSWLTVLTVSQAGRRTWKWRSWYGPASSMSRPPSLSRRILGRSTRRIPLSLTPPAILLPGTKSHPLVLVGSTRPGWFHSLLGMFHLVCISLPVLAVHMLMSVQSQLLECAPHQRRLCLLCCALPTPHPGSQDVLFVTRRWSFPLKLLSMTPKWLSLTGCLATPPTHAV